jgi:glycerophosphodiester phosphodiesterase
MKDCSTDNQRYGHIHSAVLNSQFSHQLSCLQDLAVLESCIEQVNRAYGGVKSTSTPLLLALNRHLTRPQLKVAHLSAAILNDDVHALEILRPQHDCEASKQDSDSKPMIHILLQCSWAVGSQKCARKLLSLAGSLTDKDCDGWNCLHYLVASIGRGHIMKDHVYPLQLQPPISVNSYDGPKDEDRLINITENLEDFQHAALQEKDCFRRTPLYYAAHYGLHASCRAILKRMQDNCSASISPVDAILCQDYDGSTPLHASVIGGYAHVTELMLEVMKEWNKNNQVVYKASLRDALGLLLVIAVRSDFIEIACLLISHGADIDYRDVTREGVLFIAARSGSESMLEALLEASPYQTDVDMREKARGWTALFIASVEGHLSIVKALLQAGANPELYDLNGWTAMEHAAFRGHILVADHLRSVVKTQTRQPHHAALTKASFVELDKAEMCIPTKSTSTQRAPEHEKQVLDPLITHHAIVESDSQILVTLGRSNTRRNKQTVDLSPLRAMHPWSATPELGHSIEVQASGGSGLSRLFELPLLEQMINQPLVFTSKDVNSFRIVFNLFRSRRYGATDGGTLVGRGIALSSTFNEAMAPRHESLHRDYTVPILDVKSLDLIGSVTFSFIIITPFRPTTVPKPLMTGFWKERSLTQVVGHRGSGANTSTRTNLQLGENTLQSFLTANNLGASCVEFDVQLTKDFVPVIFHEFLVMETGSHTPLHTMTFEQFMHLGNSQTSRGDLAGMAETRYFERNKDRQRKPRSRSVNIYEDYRSHDLLERMEYTEDGVQRNIRGNIRGCSVQEPVATLEQVLTELPESIAFNIELSK